MKKSSLKSRSRDKEEEEDFKKEQKKQPIQMTNDQMPKNTKAKKERDFVQIIAEAKNRVWFFKKKKFVNLNISSSSSIILYIS